MFDLGHRPEPETRQTPNHSGFSLPRFFEMFPTEDACLDHILRTRFGPDPACQKCTRPGPFHRIRAKKFYQHSCGASISPLAKTVFHSTKIPLQLWFYAMLHIANSWDSVTAAFFSRHLGLGYPAAYRMIERIRVHMAAIDETKRLGQSGEVLVRLVSMRRIRTSGGRYDLGRVLAMTDYERVVSVPLPYPRRHRANSALSWKVYPDVQLVTDCYQTHRVLSSWGFRRPLAPFDPFALFKNAAGSDDIAAFFHTFKRCLKNQHYHINEKNLWKYLREYEFRFNRRINTREIYRDMISQFPTIKESDLGKSNYISHSRAAKGQSKIKSSSNRK